MSWILVRLSVPCGTLCAGAETLVHPREAARLVEAGRAVVVGEIEELPEDESDESEQE